MALDRASIERRDFPVARRGYDPDAVHAHLARIAEEVERMRADAAGGLAAQASERVRGIVEAAERSAAQLREEAGRDAQRHVGRVTEAAAGLQARLDQAREEVTRLLEGVRAATDRIESELRDVEREVTALGGASPAPDAEAAGPPEPVAPAAPGPAAAEPAPEPAPLRSTDLEGARLVALDMALRGEDRAVAERYLAEHYELADPAALLDEVYGTVSR